MLSSPAAGQNFYWITDNPFLQTSEGGNRNRESFPVANAMENRWLEGWEVPAGLSLCILSPFQEAAYPSPCSLDVHTRGNGAKE